MKRIIRPLNGPRFWMFFSNLVMRGAGFITSFFITRILGAGALGLYSSIINTSAAVVTPFAQVLGNNATLVAVDTYKNNDNSFLIQVRANLLIAFSLCLISFLVFFCLYGFTFSKIESNNISIYLLLLASLSVIFAQIVGNVIQGFYQGAGKAVLTAKVFSVISLISALISFPVIYYFSLRGSFYLIVLTSISPLVFLSNHILRSNHIEYKIVDVLLALRSGVKRLQMSLPSIGASSLSAIANWLCTIYLVKNQYGLVGLGILAISIQWQNLLLMPVSSWGGVTLKIISESIVDGNKSKIIYEIKTLIKKNAYVTLVLGILISLLSGFIQKAYGLSGNTLVMLICLNAVYSLIASVNNVFERFYFCLNKQNFWLFSSIFSLIVQLIVVLIWIKLSLNFVVLGFIAGSITLCAISCINMKYQLSTL